MQRFFFKKKALVEYAEIKFVVSILLKKKKKNYLFLF